MQEVRRGEDSKGGNCDVMASWFDDRNGVTWKNRETAAKDSKEDRMRDGEERERGGGEKGRKTSVGETETDRIEGVAG